MSRIKIINRLVQYFNPRADVFVNQFIYSSEVFSDLRIASVTEQLEAEYFYYAHRDVRLTMENHNLASNVFGDDSRSKEEFWSYLISKLGQPDLVLDLGCGVRPNLRIARKHTILVESFDPYLNHLSSSMTNESVTVIKDDVIDLLKRQPSSSIDSIIATDVIEHLSKDRGRELIREIERVTRQTALLFTPNGFMSQHIGESSEDVWGFTGNLLQNHLSGWDVTDFPGWEVSIMDNYYQGSDTHGALGAVYRKNVSLPPRFIFIVDSVEPSEDEIRKENAFFRTLSHIENGIDSVNFILPMSRSPKSISIFPNQYLPEGQIYFTSFNFEANNDFSDVLGLENPYVMGGISELLHRLTPERIFLFGHSPDSKLLERQIHRHSEIVYKQITDGLIKKLSSNSGTQQCLLDVLGEMN